MGRDALYDRILRYPYWRQRIDLGDGRHTFGTRDASDWNRLGLPGDMSGKTFLDVGTSDGLHAIEAERRGAEDVLAIDLWKESSSEGWWYSRQPRREGFDLVTEYLDSDISGRTLDVRELAAEDVGTFDVVLCSKVLPFVPSPADVVRRLVEVTDETLVLESATSVQIGRLDAPGLQFAKQTTNNENRWWHPNVAGLEAMAEWAHGDCHENRAATIDADLVEGDAVSSDVYRRETPAQAVPVYRGTELAKQVDTVPGDQAVTVVGSHDGAVRIEYQVRNSEPHRQAWIEEDVLRQLNESSPLLSEARTVLGGIGEYVRKGKIGALPWKAKDYLKYRLSDYSGSNILLHYNVDSHDSLGPGDGRA